MMERLVCVAIGYLFGLFQTAYIYGKLHGIDIRNYGSGNAGTTNTLRVLGTKAGLIVLAGDILKCILAIAAVRLLFAGGVHEDMYYLLAMYAALGAILGHDYPFYLGFKGGKGIAATAGLILAIHPAFIPMGVILFFGTFLLTHYVSLGSLLVYAGFLIEMVIMGQISDDKEQKASKDTDGQMDLFSMPVGHRAEMYVIAAFLTAMAYWKHRENIKRLLSGTERKTYLFKKNKEALN